MLQDPEVLVDVRRVRARVADREPQQRSGEGTELAVPAGVVVAQQLGLAARAHGLGVGPGPGPGLRRPDLLPAVAVSSHHVVQRLRLRERVPWCRVQRAVGEGVGVVGERVECAGAAVGVDPLEERHRAHVDAGRVVRGRRRGTGEHRGPGINGLDLRVREAEHRGVPGDVDAGLDERHVVGFVPDLPDAHRSAPIRVGRRRSVAVGRGGREAGEVGGVGREAVARSGARGATGPRRAVGERPDHEQAARVGFVNDRVGRAVPAEAVPAVALDRVPVEVECDPAGAGRGHGVQLVLAIRVVHPQDARARIEPCPPTELARASRCRGAVGTQREVRARIHEGCDRRSGTDAARADDECRECDPDGGAMTTVVMHCILSRLASLSSRTVSLLTRGATWSGCGVGNSSIDSGTIGANRTRLQQG